MSATIDIRELNEMIEKQSGFVTNLQAGMDQVIVGQKHLIESLLIGLLSDGHILLEGVPGLAKTLAIKTLAQLIDSKYSRIQFTPDLLPADVLGTMIYSQKTEEFVVKKGPIFANFILADEINRATPKTQSAMLEAMQEHKVTVANTSYKMEEPFFVLATENPIEQDGTYPLPEAQMDRFMFKLVMEFPSIEELTSIVNMTQITMDETANAVVNGETILKMRELAKDVPVVDEVLVYAMNLVTNTHPEISNANDVAKKYIKYGASPRAGQALITAAKVRALINGNYNVSYEDIDALAYPVLRHRIKVNYTAINERLSTDDVIGLLIKETKKACK